jgi:hypothetical protein
LESADSRDPLVRVGHLEASRSWTKHG